MGAMEAVKKTDAGHIRTFHGLAVTACILYTTILAIWMPAARVALTSGVTLTIWHGELIQWCRWPLVTLGIALSLSTIATGRIFKKRCSCRSVWRKILRCLGSACLLPLVGVALLLADMLPPDICANAIVFVPSAAASWSLACVISPWLDADNGSVRGKRWAWPLFIVSAVLYALLGYYVAKTAGEHVGDEGHYLIQAESLYKDHDLDIKNNILDGPDRVPGWANVYSYMHLSRNSRGDHWYSYHPFGLPILLAPFWPLGMLGRYVLLALIAAAGNVGMYRMSCAAGAGKKASLIAVASLAATFYWATYSGRALPEVLGAALLSWLFWALLVQERRQWLSVTVGAFCCTYLAVAQERFVPVSLMGFGFYGLFGLFSKEKWRRKLVRLSVFTALCAVGWGLFILSQFAMFEGGMKYSTKGVMLSYPLGMWGIIAETRGLVSILPLLVWLMAAFVVWVFLQRKRLIALAIPATFLTCIFTSCSVTAFRGGACVPGRYILVVVPLLIPCAAYVLERTNAVARWWFLFLSTASVALLVVALPLFESMGRKFVLPVSALQATEPLLVGMYHPHSSFMHITHPWEFWSVTLYVITAILSTVLATVIPRRHRGYAVPALLIVCCAGCVVHASRPKHSRAPAYGRVQLSEYLGRIRRGDLRLAADVSEPINLYDISRYEFKDFKYAQAEVGVTTQDLGTRVKGRMISQPRLDRNDWQGRVLCWATLTRPFPPIRGDQILHIEGRLEGDAKLLLAVKEGGKIRYECPLPVDTDGKVMADVAFRCSGFAGHLYILAHLSEGEGTFHLDEFYWSPFSDSILNSPAITIPGNAILR